MTSKLLSIIGEKYPLDPIEAGDLATLKVKGMRFEIRAYHAEGLGHVSVMSAKGLFGLMKMDTLMIVPDDIDLPLYSYDRIYAMGKDILILELYDTMTAPADLSSLAEIKEKFSRFEERALGEHWYDSIKLPESISKKERKKLSPGLDELALDHFTAYLAAPVDPVSDKERKAKLSADYVIGLLEKGGAPTNIFKKALGREKTERLFRDVLFGIG
jgi:hypothetical protein